MDKGLYEGESKVMGLYDTVAKMTVRNKPSTLDMRITITGASIDITCPNETYVATKTQIKLTNLSNPNDCIAKHMKQYSIHFDSVVYDNTKKTINLSIICASLPITIEMKWKKDLPPAPASLRASLPAAADTTYALPQHSQSLGIPISA